ncbi:MAG TPA: DUF6152 family protein [Vicinamibacterales bacterium]|nr:DUF6152 family protein [Vicinamibacterales bacterium]
MSALWSAAVATAHHSHGNYTDTFIDLQGTVKEVHLINPHSWVYVDVKAANGQLQTWSLEATNRVALERMGITQDFLKPGDAIKARCHPLRDGSRGCLLGFLKAKDGSIKDWDGNNLPIPTDF